MLQRTDSPCAVLNVFIAREIAALPVAKDTIVVNVINPGLCVSELRRDINGSFLGWALDSLARTGEEGARNIAWAATEEVCPVIISSRWHVTDALCVC